MRKNTRNAVKVIKPGDKKSRCLWDGWELVNICTLSNHYYFEDSDHIITKRLHKSSCPHHFIIITNSPPSCALSLRAQFVITLLIESLRILNLPYQDPGFPYFAKADNPTLGRHGLSLDLILSPCVVPVEWSLQTLLRSWITYPRNFKLCYRCEWCWFPPTTLWCGSKPSGKALCFCFVSRKLLLTCLQRNFYHTITCWWAGG